MKPVSNTALPFPKVGDILRLAHHPVGCPNPQRVIHITPCDHRSTCRQDNYCRFCLTLCRIGDAATAARNHCWNDPQGNPYWIIVEEEE